MPFYKEKINKNYFTTVKNQKNKNYIYGNKADKIVEADKI